MCFEFSTRMPIRVLSGHRAGARARCPTRAGLLWTTNGTRVKAVDIGGNSPYRKQSLPCHGAQVGESVLEADRSPHPLG